jgi:hypothetical protein
MNADKQIPLKLRPAPGNQSLDHFRHLEDGTEKAITGEVIVVLDRFRFEDRFKAAVVWRDIKRADVRALRHAVSQFVQI